MLVGLLFAIAEAEDRPGLLAATLPFEATTLVEYQARLLQSCGAEHIVVVVQRLSPELTGAVARLSSRGLTIDVARDAASVLARVHPLAAVMMLADALVTTEGVVRLVADAAGDALLTTPDGSPQTDRFELLGGGVRWGGVARLNQARVAEAAALPADYDLQSTLLRAAEQAGARHVALADGERQLGHGIERRGAALEERGRAMLAATLALRANWFDRFLVRPMARRLIPMLARRTVPTAAVLATGSVVAVVGIGSTVVGLPRSGMVAVLAAATAIDMAGVLALFRDEPRLVDAARVGATLAALCASIALAVATGGVAAPLLATGGITAAVIAERAAGVTERRLWWGTPGGYLVVIALLTVAGQSIAALACAAAYAVTTLAAAVEALRRQA